jgi:hypothetical protein
MPLNRKDRADESMAQRAYFEELRGELCEFLRTRIEAMTYFDRESISHCDETQRNSKHTA